MSLRKTIHQYYYNVQVNKSIILYHLILHFLHMLPYYCIIYIFIFVQNMFQQLKYVDVYIQKLCYCMYIYVTVATLMPYRFNLKNHMSFSNTMWMQQPQQFSPCISIWSDYALVTFSSLCKETRDASDIQDSVLVSKTQAKNTLLFRYKISKVHLIDGMCWVMSIIGETAKKWRLISVEYPSAADEINYRR